MDCIPALVVVPRCFRQIVSDKTLQVLRRRHPRSRWRRRFAWGLEPVDTAGRVGFRSLFSDPSGIVAKSSWCQVAKLEEGRFHWVPRREKWLKVFVFSVACICLCWKLLEFGSMVRFLKLSCESGSTWISYCPTKFRLRHFRDTNDIAESSNSRVK